MTPPANPAAIPSAGSPAAAYRSADLRESVECVPDVAEGDEAQDAQTDEEREQPEEKREPLNAVVVVPYVTHADTLSRRTPWIRELEQQT